MNLTEWDAMDDREKEKALAAEPIVALNFSRLPYRGGANFNDKKSFMRGVLLQRDIDLGRITITTGEQVKCPPALIQLRDQLKQQIDDEMRASKYYLEAAGKMIAFSQGNHPQRKLQSEALKIMANEEAAHHIMLKFIINGITKECGE